VAATKTKRKNSIASIKADHRAKKGRDHSPQWAGCEDWDTSRFLKFFKESMDYYRLEKTAKDLKPEIINWMGHNGYTKDQIKALKDTKDWRCGLTMGSIAANLNRGMPPVRTDFNEGRNTAQWLGSEITKIIKQGADDAEPEEPAEEKSQAPVISIQDRLREAAARMTDEIEEAIESFQADPEAFDPRPLKS
jgi:hypothetical protein